MTQRTPPAPLILLVGMHRSGTSLLGSLLDAIDIRTPGPLIQADQHNPQGYYERHDITALQEQLLITLGHWWPSQAGVAPLPSTWLQHPATRQAALQLEELLAQEMAQQPGPWAIKDPRSSLLLPLWREVAGRLQLPMQLVLTVRDPAEVMTSLLQRDRDATGMTAWRAQQLWWRHHHSLLLERGDLPLQVVHYSRWFHTDNHRQLDALHRFCRGQAAPAQPDQVLQRVRPEHRRSRQRRHAPVHPKLRQLERRLLAVADGRQSLEQLQTWLQRQPDPLSLPLAGWRRGRASSALIRQSAWWNAARALGAGQAAERLHRWHQQGGPDAHELSFLALLPPCSTTAARPLQPPAGRQVWSVMGADAQHWWVHAWLQQLPIAPAGLHGLAAHEPLPPSQPLLHLQDLKTTMAQGRLESLQRCSAVYDPNPERVHLMQWLGITALLVTPCQDQDPAWLDGPADQPAIGSRLGLPDPRSLLDTHGHSILVLGKGSPEWEARLSAPFWNLPGFDELQLACGEDARLLASWLQHCQRIGLQLVRLGPSPQEQAQQAWDALSQPASAHATGLTPQLFRDPIDPEELLRELEWRRQGSPAPSPHIATPQPSSDILWSSGGDDVQPEASVCISLFNYAGRILQALESVLAQTLSGLELIVVDDHSSDGGHELTRQWLAQHADRFCRTLLLRHQQNAGLAAARNTAFTAAQAPWCFVLDADNQLLPEAVRCCLQVARHAEPRVAVVHPLVERRLEGSQLQPSSFLSDLSWQGDRFRHGNVIDAMALIRRQAWQEVGGYCHIPGGWEDFDFWCLLIDAGWHGLLCPQRLAIYNSHATSMLASSTKHRARSLSRLLEARHPWLQLAPADKGA
jgi:GT2 family glycosyltransferase